MTSNGRKGWRSVALFGVGAVAYESLAISMMLMQIITRVALLNSAITEMEQRRELCNHLTFSEGDDVDDMGLPMLSTRTKIRVRHGGKKRFESWSSLS